ncbi:hypothetical protein MTR_1g032400 [Medicago truncatula]|uniref:Bifunctional inhibitor/plant lipid transfer protein/seed storage helical n=1 Tax=Medicago truncatula TaxID=3880 RepID=G8A041_MEDTR|nr:hypothetical protein MTR_1g032050 [Medicago truncatula]KEH40619.1 hypothetical protein MTR_1g032400 [Medicago truncatula]
MKRVNVFKSLTLVLTFLAFAPKMESEIIPPVIHLPPPALRPLCAPQLALVSYACGMLPYTPGSPSSPILPPLSPSSSNDGGGHQSHHNHHHRHGHRHRHHDTTQEDNCCRWARALDSRCVCEILVRLPPFLIRPLHTYSVVFGESCTVTYSCGGPI